MNKRNLLDSINESDIAIISMTCRFPGAKDIDAFWQNLRDGKESISFFSEPELVSSGIEPARLSSPNYVKANAVLSDIELFDASFFGFSAREAEIIDPQHRLFLECAWEVMESAGYDSETYEGAIGVYAGAGINTYLLKNLYPNRDLLASVGEYQLMLASDKDFLPTRVSYKLNLKGPSINVQTACSTSLVAVHLACQSLLNGECDMALAGGVSVRVPQKAGYLYQEGHILSPDGHCRAFDARSQGTVGGNGVGIVVLKRLADAIADGDCIHAIIKGSAINNDGSLKVAYTAPSVDAQAAVISEAQAIAGINAETLTYIETHGTGTSLGDPIEIAALTQAFGASTQNQDFCAIGSVKTNFGHLDAAAGVAGLIKTVLALKHKLLPPSLHFEQPNPNINFANSPFHVNNTLSEWKTDGTPRRAGVSSFGIGGTNAHVVLEEAPAVETRDLASLHSRPWQLLAISAKTSSALETATANLAEHLKQHPDLNLADVAYTLSKGRRAFNHRRILVCQNIDEAEIALSTLEPQRVFTHFHEPVERPIAFMFSGQGTQYVNMGLEIYQAEPTFREQIELCSELLKPQLGLDLRQVLYPSEERVNEAAQQLQQTGITQPALFVIEYALAKLLDEWGLRPQVAIGHSIGEFVAACLSGVFSLEDALRLVAIRGRLMAELPSGAMLSVALPASDLAPQLSPELSIAANNAPSLCVVSGPEEAVGQLEAQLIKENISCRRLHTSHAFHSPMMEPVILPFLEEVRKVRLYPPQIPYISNVTGTWITASEATDPAYWAKHLRQTVQFGEGVKNLVSDASYALLEVGPGRVLSTLARQCLGTQNDNVILSTIRHPQEHQSDVAFLLTTLGRLWMSKVNVDWLGLYKNQRRYRLALPTYPFERRRYWIEPQVSEKVSEQQCIEIESFDSSEISEAAPVAAISLPTFHPRPNLTNNYVAPRDEREQLIAEVWQNLLGVAPIGIHDSFFELGGHSLLAAQVMERVSEKLGVKIPIRLLTEQPTIAGLVVGTAELTNEQAYSEDGNAGLPVVVPEPNRLHEPFPLRDMQQAQWIGRLGGFNLSNVSAHVYFEIESDHIDLERLNQAWRKVMERHPMLKAVILPDGRQQILDQVPDYEIKVVDLRGQSQEAIAAHLQLERERLSTIVRPVNEWPLFEICATRLDENRIRFFLSFELIITDVGSLRILSRDWHRFYRSDEKLMEPLEISYRDYLMAEMAVRESPQHARALEYWRERVKTLPPAPELPTLKSLESVTQPKFTRYAFRLSKKEWNALKQSAARYSVTPSAVLAAAFSSVLSTWSKRAHFTLNLTILDRLPLHPQVKYLIGEFGSFDLLEVDASTSIPFAELMRRMQKQAWENLDYRYVSGIRKLRELAQVKGGTSGAVMPVVFASTIVQHAEPDDTELYTWLGEVVYQIAQTPQMWLDHTVLEDRGELELSWVIVEELFPPGLVDDMWGAYCRFVKDLSEREEIWQETNYDWLPEEQRATREAVNATAGIVPEGLLQEPFAHQASTRPDQPALIATERTLSYRELYRRANQLGRQLRAMDVQPNTLVGVAIEKSWEQIVAILGVLNAGAAYLPINLDLPEERQLYLIEHGEVKVMLTCDGQPVTSQWPQELKVVAVDQEGWEGSEGDPLLSVQAPDNLAYVLYTSGSTGAPKGVALTHRAALNTILDINERFSVGPQDTVLALSSLSFDLSVYDVFGLLAAGGTIVLPEAGASRDPKRWLELMRAHRVTLWNSVPALMEMLVEQVAGEQQGTPLALRLVLMSGDWIPLTLPERVKQLGEDVRLMSLGGATEAAIWSIAYRIEQVDPTWQSIPYGKPLKNQWFAVLNERLEPCPVWVPGQLYIGGIGLAQGYWRDEEKTNASFIIHPRTGERLYRTGDLGRYLPDGNIEFLGREDFQVKIRGYRIELGEIEAALVEYPAVKTSVVLAVESDRNHRRLLAYVVPHSESGELSFTESKQQELWAELRGWIESKLPSYMMPQSFVLLDKLPLTPTGKVDRKALMSSKYIGDSEPEQVNLKSDPVVVELAAIVAEILGVKDVGIHQNFFEMGGDSIMAIQIIARANAQGYELNPQDIFTHQTIAELAMVVKKTVKEERMLTGRIPLTPFQQRILENALPVLSQNVQQVTLELAAGLDRQLAEQALQYLMQHHDALRLRFMREESGWVQMLVDDIDSVHIPFIDLSPLMKDEQELAVEQMMAEMRAETNLSQGPLTKMAVFELGEGRSQLVWLAHRLIVSDRSWEILLSDFSTVYAQLSCKDMVWLPPRTVSFKEWAERIQQYVESEATWQELATWLKLGASEVHLLPANRGKHHATDKIGNLDQLVSVSLSVQETKTLLEEVPSTYRMSLTETALAAFANVLHAWTKEPQQLVELECEAREGLFAGMDLTRTVGCFTSVFPLLLDINGVEGYANLLKAVKEQFRCVLSCGVGYDGLRFKADADVAEALRSVPQPQVAFRNLGHLDWRLSDSSPLTLTQPFLGPTRDSGVNSSHLLELTVFVSNHQLQILWNYRRDQFARQLIEHLAESFLNELRAIIAHCQSPDAGAYIPNDFPHADLNQEELDALLAALN